MARKRHKGLVIKGASHMGKKGKKKGRKGRGKKGRRKR